MHVEAWCLGVRLRDWSKDLEVAFADGIHQLPRAGLIDLSSATNFDLQIIHGEANRHLFRGSSDDVWSDWSSRRRVGDVKIGIQQPELKILVEQLQAKKFGRCLTVNAARWKLK
ncbi:hypothetical protein MMC22_008128 [Lobaria immixta]|nr:hypothetical protein [Lobaria immixta]